MATASSLLLEDKFLCSICLDVFTEPVSTPCGHNFCKICIRKYWDGSDNCHCPLCKKIFSTRPELHINTVISELAADFKKITQVKVSTLDQQLPKTAVIPCDICSGTKDKAVKSCLTCLTSFCEAHVEPHWRVAGLKGHKLIDPVGNLDERLCKIHNKMTELYCRTDQTCICVLCTKTNHKSHNVVLLEEEYEALMAKNNEAMADIQKLVQTRCKKIAEIEDSLDVSEREAEKEKEAAVQVFTDLIRSIQRGQTELVEVIEERLRATKKKGEGFLRDLRMDVAELESRSRQLQQLANTQDHHHFLQSFPSLCSPLNTDWTNTAVDSDLSFEAVTGAVTLLKQRVHEIMDKIPEIKMKRMKEHAVDLTLDPDTAHCSLVISQDGKQVVALAKEKATVAKEKNLAYNPKRFEIYTEVLAKEGFTTGRFYFEVQVQDKTQWAVGVVRESVDRKGDTDLSVSDGYLTIGLDEGMYYAYENSAVTITLKENLQKVGIFVDYDEGVVSFYDVDSVSHIYSFTGYHFTEKMYPYFCPQGNCNGTNSAPLIITPVPHTV